MWNDTALPTSYFSGTQVIGFVPSDLLTLHAGVSATITVVNPGGAASNALTFALDPPRPSILSPASANAPAGSESLEVVVPGRELCSQLRGHWNGTGRHHLRRLRPPEDLPTPCAAVHRRRHPDHRHQPQRTRPPPPRPSPVAVHSRGHRPQPLLGAAAAATFTLTVNGALFTPASVVLWNSRGARHHLCQRLAPHRRGAGQSLPGTYSVTVTQSRRTGLQPRLLRSRRPRRRRPRPHRRLRRRQRLQRTPRLAPGALISIYGVSLALVEARATASTPLPPPSPVPRSALAASMPRSSLSAPRRSTRSSLRTRYRPGVGDRCAGGSASPAVKLEIAATAPGILTSDNAHAVAVNYPGAVLNSAATPPAPATTSCSTPPARDCSTAPWPTAPNRPRTPSLPLAAVEVASGGVPAQVAFAGLAPGFVGLLQVNLVVPKFSGDPPVNRHSN